MAFQGQQGQPMQYNPQGQPVVQGYAVPGQEFDGGKTYIGQASAEVRNGFIRKVYSILTVQLFITFAIAFYMNTQLSLQWVASHMIVFQIASWGTLALMIGVSCCCSGLMRQFPINYALLLLITVGISMSTGLATVLYTTDSVMLCLATTAIVFFSLTAYACLTQTDFTGMGPYLMAALFALCGFGFVMMLWSMFTGQPLHGTMMQKVYACGGVLLFSLFIVYDTQLIVGGSHKKHQFEIDDYCFAALSLYLDVVNLFLFLLELMGDRR